MRPPLPRRGVTEMARKARAVPPSGDSASAPEQGTQRSRYQVWARQAGRGRGTASHAAQRRCRRQQPVQPARVRAATCWSSHQCIQPNPRLRPTFCDGAVHGVLEEVGGATHGAAHGAGGRQDLGGSGHAPHRQVAGAAHQLVHAGAQPPCRGAGGGLAGSRQAGAAHSGPWGSGWNWVLNCAARLTYKLQSAGCLLQPPTPTPHTHARPQPQEAPT